MISPLDARKDHELMVIGGIDNLEQWVKAVHAVFRFVRTAELELGVCVLLIIFFAGGGIVSVVPGLMSMIWECSVGARPTSFPAWIARTACRQLPGTDFFGSFTNSINSFCQRVVRILYMYLSRIGSRGDCQSMVSDVSSLELYLMNNVNTNPFRTVGAFNSTWRGARSAEDSAQSKDSL